MNVNNENNNYHDDPRHTLGTTPHPHQQHRPRLTQSFSQANPNFARLLVLRLSGSILPRDIAVNLLKIVIKKSQNVH